MTGSGKPAFNGSKIKLSRARRLIEELEAYDAEFQRANPPKVTTEETLEGSVTHLNVAFPDAGDGYGAIVGDIIHNLRAALDLLAVELVARNGGDTRDVHFPFCASAIELDQTIKRRKFNRAPADAVALLKQLKPYKSGNVVLRALHDLDIQDKHHSLIPTAQLATTPELTADMSSGSPIIKLVQQSAPSVVYTFPSDSPLGDAPIIATMYELADMVQSIVEQFAAISARDASAHQA